MLWGASSVCPAPSALGACREVIAAVGSGAVLSLKAIISIAAAVKRGGFALLIINQLSIDYLLGFSEVQKSLILQGFQRFGSHVECSFSHVECSFSHVECSFFHVEYSFFLASGAATIS